jgi:hypothetical protein
MNHDSIFFSDKMNCNKIYDNFDCFNKTNNQRQQKVKDDNNVIDTCN